MRNFLNEKSLQLEQGVIRAIFDKARHYPDAINLGIGEPDLDTPAEVVKEGCEALQSGKTHYTGNAGLIELRREVAKYLQKCEITADPETEVVITTGGMGALALALLVTLSPGDEVLIQDPQWLNYYYQVKFFGGTAVPVPVYEEDGFKITADELRKRITKKTKIIMLNSPNNPTGAVLEYNDLKEIADLAREHDLLVLSDEVYSSLVYDGLKHCSIASIPGMQERTIVVNSFSKTFAMTGWRIGFASGNKTVIKKMTNLQENLVACVNTPAQYAAIRALNLLDKADTMTELYRKRRDIILEELSGIEGITCHKPKGSFYVFPNIKALGISSDALANELLEKAGVVTVPGSAFGNQGEGYLRMSYANSEENLKEAMKRIKSYLAKRQ